MDTDNNSKRVYRVVLTGGPCGGKTTGQSRLSTFFENLGWKVFRVPKTAIVLQSGGIKFSDLSEDEAYKIQVHLIKTMIQIEETYFNLADSCTTNCLIVCDGGFMDALAHIPSEGIDDLMTKNGWNFIDMRDNRYNQIIHLVSAVYGAEKFYSTEDHESIESAKILDRKSAEAWTDHPCLDVIDNSTDFESKMNKMIEVVCQRLGIDTGHILKTSSRQHKFLIT